MEIFAKVLQSSYAYLLVVQILVVSTLLLALVWLIIRRTQEAGTALANEIAPEPTLAVDANPVIVGIPEEEANELRQQLEAAREQLKNASAEAQGMRDKIKYLESRLLEYEILQEEIGTLSQLKVENERLKEELGRASGQPVPAPVPAAPAEAAAPPENPPLEFPPGISEALNTAMDTPPPPEAPSGALSSLTGLLPDPSSAPAEAALASAEATTQGLENLLAQIDKLSGPGA